MRSVDAGASRAKENGGQRPPFQFSEASNQFRLPPAKPRIDNSAEKTLYRLM